MRVSDQGNLDQPDDSAPNATVLLNRISAGDAAAAEALMPLVYDHLRATAAANFQDERTGHTLQPTALVHEAFVKLVNQKTIAWTGKGHFYAFAARAMRQILVDHARARGAQKRGGDAKRRRLTLVQTPDSGSPLDVLALEEILKMLTEIDPEGARVVELRFFGGLNHMEIARVMDLSVKSVERRWFRSRALIKAKLSETHE